MEMEMDDVDMDLVAMMMLQLEDELFRDLQAPPTDPPAPEGHKSHAAKPGKRRKKEEIMHMTPRERRSVAARHRRIQINERMQVLQRMVPGGTKMDTASMLDQAVKYVMFLKDQVQALEMAVNVVALAPAGVDRGAWCCPLAALEPWPFSPTQPPLQEADLCATPRICSHQHTFDRTRTIYS